MTDSETTRHVAPNPAKGVAIVMIALLLVIVALYVVTDRRAPGSSRGTVSASVVQIAPRVSGEVTQVMVADDAVVQPGQVLFEIDPRPYRLAVLQANANLAAATQKINASSASLIAAQAAVTQAQTVLETTLSDTQRTLRLEERGVVSKAQADTARVTRADAETRLQAAEANLDSARAQLGPEGQDNPALIGAEAQLEKAQLDLAGTQVLAPHLGVVTNLTLSPGQFAAAGSPVLTFIDAQAAWITVDLRENQLGNVDPGDPAIILFDARPGQLFEGRVQSVAWGINPGRNQQGGLVVNQPTSRWFGPARHIPVRLELVGGMETWPRDVPVGGKVTVTVLAEPGGPIEWLARATMRLRAITSYLH